VGLTQYSAALIVNRRFANLPEGAPNFMFNWGEDSIMRERMFVLPEQQADYELHPKTLPGVPGEANQ
jgi:peptide/nickel transport system substrate-binding protein